MWQSIDKRKSRMDDLSMLLTRTHVGLSVLEERIAVVPQIMQRGHLLPTPEYLPSVWPPIGNASNLNYLNSLTTQTPLSLVTCMSEK